MRLNQPLPPNIPTRSVIIAGVFYLWAVLFLFGYVEDWLSALWAWIGG